MKFVVLAIFLVFTDSVLAEDQSSAATETRPELTRDLTLDHSLQDLQLLVTPLTVEELDREAQEWQIHVQDAMMQIATQSVR